MAKRFFMMALLVGVFFSFGCTGSSTSGGGGKAAVPPPGPEQLKGPGGPGGKQTGPKSID